MTLPLAIQIENLKFSYPKAQAGLNINHWQVKKGEQIFLYGDSGSGKSTLLNLLSGILVPDSGEIKILKQSFSELSERKRDKFRANHIGVVFQQFNLIPYLSVQKNIELAVHFAGRRIQQSLISQMLTQLKLDASVSEKPASALSIGQQQRVAIARALINQPDILLVDEPTSALDANARDAFMDILLAMCQQCSTTLIFVSHDLSLQHYFSTSLNIKTLQHPESFLC
ncbi:ABC transporter ATP-binding protein [Catenovulum sp. 2E275]|uniref:ABC transporter ATP-binding protein n=1 Tax=Catenovulum sp. 2E275 TaxID=2980497 RepID=UPI0021CE89B9|nr:ABC transporter ATP-binding protein [Catenovulum sp. 2E275]MCU4674155.1 ABC transporter ATP-binding protein [Catenovulum sp. 2E275]